MVVTDTPLFARSVAGGQARVADVPAGNYQLHVWHSSLGESVPPQLVPLTVGAADVEQRLRLDANGLAR